MHCDRIRSTTTTTTKRICAVRKNFTLLDRNSSPRGSVRVQEYGSVPVICVLCAGTTGKLYHPIFLSSVQCKILIQNVAHLLFLHFTVYFTCFATFYLKMSNSYQLHLTSSISTNALLFVYCLFCGFQFGDGLSSERT